MQKLPRNLAWMHGKYGDDTQPWEITLRMPNTEGGVDGVWAENAQHNFFKYKFGQQDTQRGEMLWEREPNRSMSIQNASSYEG